MTAQETQLLVSCLLEHDRPSTPGGSYNNGVYTKAIPLVDGIENPELASDPAYRAGYLHAWRTLAEMLVSILIDREGGLKDRRALAARHTLPELRTVLQQPEQTQPKEQR